MRAMLAAFAAIILISVGAGFALNEANQPSGRFEPSVRISADDLSGR